MIWYKDKENTILRVNRSAAESIGLPVEELEGRSVYDLYPDEAAQYHEADLQVIQSGGPKLGIVEMLQTASGEKRWIQTDKIPYRDQEGNIIGVIVFAVDISDRMQAEMEVRESEKRYRDLVETSNDLICALDLGGRWTFVNRTAAMRILGYAPEEMLGRRFAEFIPQERLDDAMETFERVKTGAPQIGYETAFLRKDGAPVDMSFNTLALRAPNGKVEGVMCIGTDITERKRLEGELFQAQKLDAIGRLAGGVAHDFNNLLSGIIGFTELTLRELPEGSRGHGYLSRVPGMGRQAADLTGQLLAFARKAPLERRALNLNLALWEAAGLLKRTLPESLYLQVEASPEPLLVEADLAQIQQVLLNLASNARDAMVQGGALTLRSARITFDEQGASAYPERRPGAFARLTVADTGTGIPEAIRDRIFEPFFTTKVPGEGTGLGLASAHGAVHQHEGWIEVETAIGQGTAVHAFLPLLPQPVALAAEPEMEVPRGTETLLLVEDNPMVRELGEVLLTQLGYTVLTASDGVEALVTFQARPGIALVITDAIMPRMGASEMVPGLQRINPGIKVLVITGYTPEAIKESLRHLAICGFIQKPFRHVDLAVAVREALDGSLSRIA